MFLLNDKHAFGGYDDVVDLRESVSDRDQDVMEGLRERNGPFEMIQFLREIKLSCLSDLNRVFLCVVRGCYRLLVLCFLFFKQDGSAFGQAVNRENGGGESDGDGKDGEWGRRVAFVNLVGAGQ